MDMAGRRSLEMQGVRVEDAIDFLREGALVREIGGKPALTSKGERFLYELSLSEGTADR
jgi:chromosome segregation and condensation protein ScpB